VFAAAGGGSGSRFSGGINILDLPAALPAATGVRPREKSQNGSRVAHLVTEIEVIGGRVIEVDGALDEPESEDAGVKVEVALRAAGDAGDVMNTGGPETHRPDSCLATLWRLALVRAGTGRASLAAISAFVLVGV